MSNAGGAARRQPPARRPRRPADPKEAEQLTQNLTTSLLSLGKLCPAILK